MIRKLLPCLLLSFSGIPLGAAPPPPPEGVKPLEVGASAPDFTLPGIDDKEHSLSDYDDADVLAVLFTCNHCPSAQAAEERIKQMVRDYADASFQLVAISPNNAEAVRIDELGYSIFGDSLEDMKLHAEEFGFNFPYLYDGEKQEASMAFGALATPHIFIFDKERKLRYQGRIDDSRYADGVTQTDARNAIDALLAGKEVPVETTRAFGCSTKWAYKIDKVAETEAAWKELPVTVEKIDSAGVKELAANDTDKLRYVNLWATWCGPCIEEFPDLIKIGRQFESRGFDMITISTEGAEYIDNVRDFLKEEHAAMPRRTAQSVEKEGRTTNNYVFDGSPDELAEALDPEWQGPIPYSIIIAPGGEIIYRHAESVIDPIEVRRVILDHLGRFYQPKS